MPTVVVKSGLHISRKDRKYIFENMFFKLFRNGLVSVSIWPYTVLLGR